MWLIAADNAMIASAAIIFVTQYRRDVARFQERAQINTYVQQARTVLDSFDRVG